MRRFFKTVSIALLCGLLAAPAVDARGRNNNNGGASTYSSRGPQGGGNQGGNPGGGNQGNPGSRPDGGGNQGGNRPGGGGNQGGNRPGGGNQAGTNRPNTGSPQRPNQGHNPGGPGGPGYNPGGPGHGPGGPGHGPGGPGYGPGPGHGHGYPAYGVPPRPLMPPPRPWARPVPPPHFRPYAGVPVISTILGVALGTALDMSMNILLGNGYNVAGYGNNVVYLNNVNQLNMYWPNATLFYNNGYLCGSEFVYSTPYYDMNRYNTAYSMLTASYGMPITTESVYGGGIQTTWYGYNNQFVRLQYMPQTAMNGTMRYYTVLSFGN